MHSPLARRLVASLLVASALLGLAAPVAAATAPGSRRWSDDVLRTVQAAVVREKCTRPASSLVPEMVAEIFSCRLAGRMPRDQAHYAVVEAVTVAHCESLFDPAAIVFDGRYTDRPHPRTGLRYTAAGVFQFIRKTGDRYIEGGYAAATDPVANINAAASLYLDNRARGGGGWEDWECSAVNGAFKSSSVLPGWPGGPERMPPWAYELADRLAPAYLDAVPAP